jgi:acetyl esterase/lipase
MAAMICKSQRLQTLFNIPGPNISINALAITCGFMDWTRRGVMSSGLRSFVLEKGYKKKPYYNNLILKNLPEVAGLPPIFLSTNGDDGFQDMTFDFVNTLKKHNVNHHFVYLEKNDKKKLGHVFNIFHFDWEETRKLNDELVEFLLKH